MPEMSKLIFLENKKNISVSPAEQLLTENSFRSSVTRCKSYYRSSEQHYNICKILLLPPGPQVLIKGVSY